MPHSYELYKSVTADRSQVCDGRTPESLAMLKEESRFLQQKMSSDYLKLSAYTVSCNDAQGDIQRQSFVFNNYRPISKTAPAAPYEKNRKVSTEGESVHADVPSPDDVTAISKVADWFQNNFDLSRQPPKMPYDAQSRLHEDCTAKESSPLRRSHCRSSSMPTKAELEMWKTGQSDNLTPPEKEHNRRQLSRDEIESPSRADNSSPPPNNANAGTPSRVMLRKKSRPQHRSPQVNRNIRSIMKTPKYSEPMGFDLDSDFLSRKKSTLHRSNSMPPLGHIGDVFDCASERTASITSEDGWLPKGVEFQSNAMVYVFRK